jgi:hypothetical protein
MPGSRRKDKAGDTLLPLYRNEKPLSRRFGLGSSGDRPRQRTMEFRLLLPYPSQGHRNQYNLFACPRQVWSSNPKLLSSRLLIRSSAVRCLYSRFHLYEERATGVKILRSVSRGMRTADATAHFSLP